MERVFRATEEENRQVIIQTLEPRPGGLLLDLGCSDGAVTEFIARGAGTARTATRSRPRPASGHRRLTRPFEESPC